MLPRFISKFTVNRNTFMIIMIYYVHLIGPPVSKEMNFISALAYVCLRMHDSNMRMSDCTKYTKCTHCLFHFVRSVTSVVNSPTMAVEMSTTDHWRNRVGPPHVVCADYAHCNCAFGMHVCRNSLDTACACTQTNR